MVSTAIKACDAGRTWQCAVNLLELMQDWHLHLGWNDYSTLSWLCFGRSWYWNSRPQLRIGTWVKRSAKRGRGPDHLLIANQWIRRAHDINFAARDAFPITIPTKWLRWHFFSKSWGVATKSFTQISSVLVPAAANGRERCRYCIRCPQFKWHQMWWPALLLWAPMWHQGTGMVLSNSWGLW